MEISLNSRRYEGVIIPLSWDESGSVTSVAMSTNTEETLPLIFENSAVNLSSLLQKLLRVKGEILIENECRKLKVISFELISSYSESMM